MKITSHEFNFQGPAGNIQATLDLPEHISQHRYFSVNCHPHSQHGGSMTNKVIHTVSRGIASLGIPSIRFNFRSVGNSEGEFDHGIGEQADLKAVVAWMENRYDDCKLLLSGFSFGSYVSALAADSLSPTLLISVAPPIKRFDFEGFQRPHMDWSVIMGDQDELVEFDAVTDWIGGFDEPPEFINMAGAGHFFHGRLVELREHIERIVTTHLDAIG
ncbi:alpha/beta hydrolase [Aliikangiella marina]|uniref:Alpha/beta hydrolase n=1 Tax=Aliikangiella marina TaxID=1712262 RepID=A0A545T6K6_9GAMM|nr:CocE/NonD family hydrolase [Aliikangiella marina]TQV72860.1 alpha/beta hydrolase [Aliikangiella marina]